MFATVNFSPMSLILRFIHLEVNQISKAEQYAGLNGSRLQRFGIVPTMVPVGGLIKTVVPPGGNILICFYRFL